MSTRPDPATPAAELPRRVRLADLFTIDRLLALVSAAWLVLLGAVPLDRRIALAGTAGLLVLGLVVSLGILFRRKRVAVLLALAQLALFTAAHYQIYTAWGEHNYACQHEPGVLDWVGFTAAHVLRAADLLDCVEEFGLEIQAVKHSATLPGILLVVMHLTVDIFLLALIIRWGLNWWRRWIAAWRRDSLPGDVFAAKEFAKQVGRILDWATKSSLALCLLLILGTAYAQGWRGADWVLWPLDAVIRVVDVADAMHIFGWRLHGVQPDYWLGTLAVTLRLFAGLYIAEWVNYAQLKALGHLALRTVEEFASELTNRNAEVRRAAASALSRIGPQASGAVSELIRALADRERGVRRAAADALWEINPGWMDSPEARDVVPDFVRALADPDTAVRHAATDALGTIGPAALPAARLLVRVLADLDGSVRRAAANALGKINPGWMDSPEARDVVPDFVRALADRDSAARHAAAEALGELGPAARAAVPDLVRALANIAVRQGAVEALGKIGPPAVPHLIRALVDQQSDVRRAAMEALGAVGPTAVSELVRALAAQNSEIRQAATEALGNINPGWMHSPEARAAVPDLVRALADRDSSFRQAATEALGKINPEWMLSPEARTAVPDLARNLESRNSGVRRAAAEALGELGPAARAAVPDLVRALADRNGSVRRAATEALGKIGLSARE